MSTIRTYRQGLASGTRGYMEIVHAVLSVCQKPGVLKTHVMFECNLNTKQLDFYLGELIARGLLEKRMMVPSAKWEYRTTEKGRKFLAGYGDLATLLEASHS